MKSRVGLLGGTFNPVHLGHIDIGLKIKDAFKLEKIRYILSANPPHKNNKMVTDSKIRWKMLKTVLNKVPGLVPCDIEIKRKNPSYTIDTIKEISKIYSDEEHFFIIGSDSFIKIETWKEYVELLAMISFIVVLRDELDRKEVISILDKIGVKYKSSSNLIGKEKKMVFFYSYKSDKLNFSSTEVRENIRKGKGVKNFLDPDIIDIIKGNNLYGSK